VTLADLIDAVKADAVVTAVDPSAEVSGCFAADLMSDVLAFARPGSVLITGLTTDQAVRTAAIKHLPAVLVVEGKQVGVEMTEAARDEGVSIYRTMLSKYEVCGLLMQAGLRPYRKTV
jgi:predicted transcriptional regulator